MRPHRSQLNELVDAFPRSLDRVHEQPDCPRFRRLLSYWTARHVIGGASSPPLQIWLMHGTRQFRYSAWHAACDSAVANGFEPFAARQQKDIAMHTSIGAVAERPFARRLLAATAGLAFGLAAALPAKAQDTIKVGILHSLSGTMAISETTLKDVMLMLIEEQNKKGGL